MKHLGITVFSGFVFLVAAFSAGILPASSIGVSRETGMLERYRETFTVKQGVSQNGQLAIVKIPDVPTVPPRIKSANHERTLRAFTAPNRGGVLTLYVEGIRPHEYYSLMGSFSLAPQYTVLTWTSETTLEFYGISKDGKIMKYIADVHLLTFSEKLIDVAAIPTKNIPSSAILP